MGCDRPWFSPRTKQLKCPSGPAGAAARLLPRDLIKKNQAGGNGEWLKHVVYGFHSFLCSFFLEVLWKGHERTEMNNSPIQSVVAPFNGSVKPFRAEARVRWRDPGNRLGFCNEKPRSLTNPNSCELHCMIFVPPVSELISNILLSSTLFLASL